MQDVTELFRGSGFKIFANIVANDPKARVWAIPAPKRGSRAFCDRMNAWAISEGQPGLGYMTFEDSVGPVPDSVRDAIVKAYEEHGSTDAAQLERIKKYVGGTIALAGK